MPTYAKDYSKTTFYKIVCKDSSIGDCYVGHTTSYYFRKACHKHRCNTPDSKYYNYKLYQFIRANGGWDNWQFDELETCSCANAIEAYNKEHDWAKQCDATLNSIGIGCFIGITPQEYRMRNRAKRALYQKAYRLKKRLQKSKLINNNISDNNDN